MEKAGNDDIEEVPVVTLKPPVVSLTAATSKTKTMEFEWKLTKLPLNTNDVEVIKFETGVADETPERRSMFPSVTCELQVERDPEGLHFCLKFGRCDFVDDDVRTKTIECELTVGQNEKQDSLESSFFQMTQTELRRSGGCMRLKKRWSVTNDYEPLRLQKDTVALWLKLRFVQIETMVDFDFWEVEEDRRANKRARMNEISDERKVVTDLGRILESKAGADCMIKTSCGKVFDVHRCILAARSPVLAEMVEPDWLRGEGLQKTIVLEDMGAKAFEFLLKFIYTGSLGSVVGLDCDAVKEILDACNKYEFPALKVHLDKSIVKVCSVGNAMRLHDVAVLHDLKEAAHGIRKFIGKNLKEILLARKPY